MFRPCIDLHEGKVKQIVGGTLTEDQAGLRTNFVSERPAAWYAQLYRNDGLKGGHVIMLGPGNEPEARSALAAYPGGLQIGGRINADNALQWLEAGASHVIVTSWVFHAGKLDWDRLRQLVETVGKEHLVLDLSCRRRAGDHWIVTDRWQTFTEVAVNADTLQKLSSHCAEFLIHAADVEGLCRGIDEELVSLLGRCTPIPTTYAGGARSFADLETIARHGQGRVEVTVGSALDIFGGTDLRYRDVVEWDRNSRTPVRPLS